MLTPPAKARELIDNAQALLAIATRRGEANAGVFAMPTAVNAEMAMAYAKDKPILPFVETGVDTKSGFISNYATYQQFDRESLLTPDFVEKAVSSIHEMKLDVIMRKDPFPYPIGMQNVFAESTKSLVELVDLSGSFTWRYKQTRRLRFTSRFIAPLKASAWASVPARVAASAEKLKWGYNIEDGSKSFKFITKIEKHTHETIDANLNVEPIPDKDDFLQYSTYFESPYLNPVYLEDLQDNQPHITINGKDYSVFDGNIVIFRTKDVSIQYRFPSSMGLKMQDFEPFVASHTLRIDYLVESEMKRLNISRESIGGDVLISITVQSPLINHMYGLAWNPPKKTHQM